MLVLCLSMRLLEFWLLIDPLISVSAQWPITFSCSNAGNSHPTFKPKCGGPTHPRDSLVDQRRMAEILPLKNHRETSFVLRKILLWNTWQSAGQLVILNFIVC